MTQPIPRPQNSPLLALFPATTPTLADVRSRIADAPSLSTVRKRDLMSAIGVVAEALKRAEGDIPGDVRWLRRALNKVLPGAKKKTWANVRSNILAALVEAGLIERRTRRIKLDAVWQKLSDQLHNRKDRNLYIGLRRFIGYCSRQGIAADAVSDETVSAFRLAIDAASLRKNPDLAIYYLTTSWNKARERVAGWPTVELSVPQRRQRLSLRRGELPKSLESDIARYLELMRCPDPLADNAPPHPLSEATIEHRERQLRRFCTELLRSGAPVSEVKDLAAIVRPEVVERGLRAMVKHRGKPSGMIYGVAYMLRAIAKHYVQLPPEELAKLQEYCRRLKPQSQGMTEKNLERLRELFRDPATIKRLLHLPFQLLHEAERARISPKRAALLVEVGLAIELSLMCLLRIKDLSRLHLDDHLQWSRAKRSGGCHLVVERAEVKNSEHLEFELEGDTLGLLNTFISRYRARLVPGASRWLFGRRDGSGPIPESVLGNRMKRIIRDRIGREVNPHLFRHLGAKLYLDGHPGGYEVVRRMLGHKSLSATLKAYTGLESISAAKHFDNTIRDLRKSSPMHLRQRRRELKSKT